MNPIQQSEAICSVVNRLVRQWCKFKYDFQLLPFYLKCGIQWDDSDMQKVFDRVYQAEIQSVTFKKCTVKVFSTDAKNYDECVEFVKSNTRASILPPLVVRTKSGDWVIIVNQGNKMLQGFSHKTGNDYVYVDSSTYDSGCIILDVIMKQEWSVCGCFRVKLSPKPTRLFTSGSDVSVIFEQAQLDTALLEETDTYESMLS